MKTNAMRVKKVALQAGWRAVDGVSHNGMAQAREVDADLVGPAGADANFQKSKSGEAPQHAVFGACGPAPVQAGGHAHATGGISSYGPVNERVVGADMAM